VIKLHISVLLDEVIESMNIKEDGIYIDATLGYGGHSSYILKKIKKGYLYAFDQDKIAINHANKRLEEIGNNFTIIKSNFKNIKEKIENLTDKKVNGILFDLGVSSPQLDEKSRGFSFHQDAPLDMRMDLDSDFSAYNVVNEYSEEKLTNIIFKYGEEKYARSIAKNIIKRREEKKIETTLELVDIIKKSMPQKAMRDKHPARKTFQAIRIEVNKELEILENTIYDALDLLDINGRLLVITFHSLEDRIIKNIFKEATKIDDKIKGLPNIPEEYLPKFELVYKKGITASKEELERNPRSRSATLRVIEKIR